MARREKSTGGLYQRASDNMWCASVELPSVDGKRRRKVIVRAKKGDAQRELRKLRETAERSGHNLPTSSPTLSRWLDTWWSEFGMVRLKLSTRPSYQSKIEQYIRPCLGRYRLDRLGPEHVDRLREYITKDKELSSTTALGAHRVLSVVLRDAERRGLIQKNPCSLTDAPRKSVYRVEYLDSSRARELLASLDPGDGSAPQQLAQLAVALLTGMRQGERLGLTREAVDLEAGVITVSWQLQRLTYEHGCGERQAGGWPCGRKKGGYCPQRHLDVPDDQEVKHVVGGLYMTRPKSEAGWRVVPMVGPLHAVMEKYLEDAEPGMEGLIFTRPDGRPIDPSDDSAAWHAALKGAGLAWFKGHSARHSCNTILKDLRVPVDVRQKILGHASRAVNEDVYTHTSDSRAVEAIQALGMALDWRTPAG